MQPSSSRVSDSRLRLASIFPYNQPHRVPFGFRQNKSYRNPALFLYFSFKGNRIFRRPKQCRARRNTPAKKGSTFLNRLLVHQVAANIKDHNIVFSQSPKASTSSSIFEAAAFDCSAFRLLIEYVSRKTTKFVYISHISINLDLILFS